MEGQYNSDTNKTCDFDTGSSKINYMSRYGSQCAVRGAVRYSSNPFRSRRQEGQAGGPERKAHPNRITIVKGNDIPFQHLPVSP